MSALFKRPIAWLLAAFLVVGAAYAVVTPLFEVSDELWHYPMVKTLADGHWLPVQDPANVGPWRQEGSQPPLYYLLMAAATAWIDTRDMDQVRWINPHTDNGLITPDRNNNIVIHRADELTRWTGTALAVRLIRLLSVLLGAATVYFTYRLAEEVLPGRPGLALSAAAVTAFTPMFVFISASVNNDNLAITLAAATLWLLERWRKQPPARLGREHLILGLLLGAGALSKSSAAGLWGLAGLVLAWGAFVGRWTMADGRPPSIVSRLSALIFQAVIVFGAAGLVCGWWYLRNFQLYGDWLGWNTFIAIVGPRAQPATLWQLWGERVGFVQAYWGLFGGVSVPLPDWAYTALNAAAGLALLGLLWALLGVFHQRPTLTQVAQWGMLVGWVGLILAGLVRWSSLTWASQGRLIFPAISAISVLLAAGLHRLWRGLPPALAVFMFGLSAAAPFAVIAPHYAPPAELTQAEIAAIPNRLDADFGGELKLLGYALRPSAVDPGGSVHLTLYWQAQSAMDRNWSLFVHLVDQDEIIAAQRDRYPGQGLLATTLMHPGQTWADDYVIALPAGAYSPARLRVRVGAYDLLDGTRLPNAAGGEWADFGQIALTDHTGTTVAGPVPNALRQNLGGLIELTGYTVDRRVLKAGEPLTLTLYWRGLAPIAANYAVSARVRDAALNRWAAKDAWPQNGAAPTASWQAGELVVDPYSLTLAADTPPGQYALEVVVYDAQTLAPLRLWEDGDRPTDAGAVVLSQIRVTP